MNKMSGIYTIKNLKSGKIYIGSAVDVHGRLHVHRHHLRKGCHPNSHLQRSWDCGCDSDFEFSHMLHCDKPDLLFYEQRAIDVAVRDDKVLLYNICMIAGNSTNRRHSKKAIEKIKAARAAQVNPRLGTKHTKETKKLLSKKRYQYLSTPESKISRMAVANSNRTRVESEETKKKRRDSLQSFWADKDRSRSAREKMSAASKRMHESRKRS